jgi:NADPH:quinone reductase-like Zn-dependent oxidoreductase
MQGDFVNRVLNGFLKPKRKILGSDIAGIVEAAGKNVTRFKTGDAVYGDLSGRWGGFAEYCCAPEHAVASKPPAMSFAEAAAIPQAGMLAVQGLIDAGKIQRGQKLLVNGAGGGVGTFAVQIARLYDAEVTGVDHTHKLDMMRAAGFHHVIDYTTTDFTRTGEQYDLILDTKTNRPAFDYARALKPQGIYVTVGGSLSRLLQMLVVRPLVAYLHSKHLRIVALKTNRDLSYLNELYEAGHLRPVIDGPFALHDFRKAFQRFEGGAHRGKVVITI